MDNDKLYSRIQDAVFRPVIKVGRKLAELRAIDVCWDREDVVQEVYLFFLKTSDGEGSFENGWELENTLFNWIRRKITEVQHHKQVINEGSQDIPLDERRAPSVDDNTGGYDYLYDHVLSLGILDDIDCKVLQGGMSRLDAAHTKGKTYDTYQKELYRKVNKIKRITGGQDEPGKHLR